MNKKALTVSEYSPIVGLPEEKLIGKCQQRPLPTARQVHWLYLRNTGYSYDKIALMYGRSRWSIMSGINTVKNLIETGDTLISPYLNFINSFSRQENTV